MSQLAVDGGTPVRTDPFPAWPVYGEEEEKLLLEVLHSGKWGGTGRIKLQELEDRFAALQQAKYAVSVSNGTIAITLALKAAGVGHGDEVIMPPYTFIATATGALMIGAIPVFADVEADTMLLDPAKVAAAITPRTKAIIAVHIGGCPADMDRLVEIAGKHKLALIEDAAQAVGAQWNGRAVGALGDAGTFSFQSSKNLNSGEGGMIVSNDKAVADIAWSIANVGRIREGAWYQHEHIGWNFRLTEFQGAILLGQLSRLEEQTQLRERNAKLLAELVGDVDGVSPMRRDARVTLHANHLFLLRIDPQITEKAGKREFLRRLAAEGIPVSAGYVPLNRNQAVLREIRSWTGADRLDECPICEHACEREVAWLPQNVLLADEASVHDIAAALRKVAGSF